MNNKRFFILNIASIILILIMIGSTMIIIDPYFHYHKPLKYFKYRLMNQRYINNGIIKYFDYNGVIIGTSMTENFRSSQFDKLFKVSSIKIPFAGATYREINDNIEVILKDRKNTKIILRGLDYGAINKNFKEQKYKEYPTYLYDDNLLNDYKYLFNKELILKGLGGVVFNTLKNRETTSFDDYSSWRDETFGKNIILKGYKREKKNIEIEKLSKADIEIIRENIQKNVLDVPLQYPNTKFIYFITPYSIVYWDSINQSGEILKQLEAEKIMIEMILEVPNIELYSFFNNYDLITNLDNYKDAGHYIYTINDKILDWISKKEYRLTKENYKEYLEKNKEFYLNYDYDSIFN
ncbi:hypothetical protein [Fusobacterium sp.]|uniref:hypothetical protein n=1 Tax=Fusobacterium sp. TaxID=68766 RepID=UPI0025BE3F9A|nr:hypothetical protein [Fusobacterium sp.]